MLENKDTTNPFAHVTGVKTIARFWRKEPRVEVDECVIEKVVELSVHAFDTFTDHLLHDYDFLSENRDAMYVDDRNVTHCLLVLGEGKEDGILVDSQGSAYARYAALLPNARSFLREKEQAQTKGTTLTLWQLMACGLEEVHLVDAEVEHEVATIVELNQTTLTEAGREQWRDVLDARVTRIYSGIYGTQIELSGCDYKQVEAFSFALAGYCSEEEYRIWMTDGNMVQGKEPAILL